MKADFTRNTFTPAKNLRRVLMQQGRVQLDADWNEQAAILLHYLQTLAADIIGPAGAPKADAGFQLLPLSSSPKDFALSPGRCYVNGLLCEIAPSSVSWSTNSPGKIVVSSWFADGLPFVKGQILQITDGTVTVNASVLDLDQPSATVTVSDNLSSLKAAGTLTHVVSYTSQPGLPSPKQLPTLGAAQAVYLDVWERAITFLQDDSMREVALGGPDTAARSTVVWQARLLDAAKSRKAVNGEDLDLLINPSPRGTLKAMAKKSAASTDPCTASPDAQYRGPENQLYRVEIHTGGTVAAAPAPPNADAPPAPNPGTAAGPPTFKWSRENGSVVFPITRITGSSSVELENLGRDDRFGLSEGDWVEFENDSVALLGIANALLQVQSIDRTALNVTLSGPVPSKLAAGTHPLLRRWDQRSGDTAEGGLVLGPDNAALIVEGSTNWLNLEDGVQIQFPGAGAVYRTGDYWLIPARTATGDVEWQRETDANGQVTPDNAPLPLPPFGVQHHYALLGTLTVAADGTVGNITPMVRLFDPIPTAP
jgi:hypothetical protein